MSTCAVMLVKDEADVIDATVRHLACHVDQIIVSDNGSTDGTREILDNLERGPGFCSVLDDPEVAYYQGRKTTELAMRALEKGHRWVIPCDADEIWYAPEGRRIADWLDATGRENQFIKALIYDHVATAKDDKNDRNPVTRIRFRKREHLDRQWGKVACRLRPDLEIRQGNHSASTRGIGIMGDGLAIRHFPYRSPEHFVRKAINGYAAYQATDLDSSIGAHWRVYGKAIEEGGEEAGRAWFLDAFFVEDPDRDDSIVYDPAPLLSRVI